jgi:hypothetical protein
LKHGIMDYFWMLRVREIGSLLTCSWMLVMLCIWWNSLLLGTLL